MDRVFQVVNPGIKVTLKNMTITGGRAVDDGSIGALPYSTTSDGGGLLDGTGSIYANGAGAGPDVTLRGVTFFKDSAIVAAGTADVPNWLAAFGGGVYSSNGTLNVGNCVFTHNHARRRRARRVGRRPCRRRSLVRPVCGADDQQQHLFLQHRPRWRRTRRRGLALRRRTRRLRRRRRTGNLGLCCGPLLADRHGQRRHWRFRRPGCFWPGPVFTAYSSLGGSEGIGTAAAGDGGDATGGGIQVVYSGGDSANSVAIAGGVLSANVAQGGAGGNGSAGAVGGQGGEADGGGLALDGVTVTLKRATIAGNFASGGAGGAGGGDAAGGGGADGVGGGIWAETTGLSLGDSNLTDNVAEAAPAGRAAATPQAAAAPTALAEASGRRARACGSATAISRGTLPKAAPAGQAAAATRLGSAASAATDGAAPCSLPLTRRSR